MMTARVRETPRRALVSEAAARKFQDGGVRTALCRWK
jgi:hypothetical protein